MTDPTPERETNPFVEVFAEDWNSKEDAVYDAPGPTPERRWTLRRTHDGAEWFVSPDGLLTGMRVALATLNEAETVRAERDALLIERADLRTAWAEPNEEIIGLRERVWGLEAALWRTEQTEMESDGKCGRCGFRDRHEKKCPWRVLETDGRARQVGRALAGAEPPDAGEMLGGLLREQASRKWAGDETKAGR